jgi:hypothetical protein
MARSGGDPLGFAAKILTVTLRAGGTYEVPAPGQLRVARDRVGRPGPDFRSRGLDHAQNQSQATYWTNPEFRRLALNPRLAAQESKDPLEILIGEFSEHFRRHLVNAPTVSLDAPADHAFQFRIGVLADDPGQVRCCQPRNAPLLDENLPFE